MVHHAIIRGLLVPYYILKDGILEISVAIILVSDHNQAEYLALLLGLFILAEHVVGGDSVRIVSDSQLLVRQLMGIYKVKQPHLQPCMQCVKKECVSWGNNYSCFT